WVHVPAVGFMEGTERHWLDEVVSDVAKSWGEDWTFQDTDPIRSVLSRALHGRPDEALLHLAFVPPDFPLIGTVSIYAVEAIPVDSWATEGFEVDSYDMADLGPGIQCIEQERVVGTEETLDLIHADYVFTDGLYMVLVTVDTTMQELFVAMLPLLHQILGRLDVQLPDGKDFRSSPIPGYTPDVEDVW